MGVASLVLGIISTAWAVFGGVTNWVAIIIGVIGIILGAIGKKNGASCSVGGLALSIVGAALALVMWLACAACVASVGGLF